LVKHELGPECIDLALYGEISRGDDAGDRNVVDKAHSWRGTAGGQ